jgi:YHS domain-containing protein
VNNLPLPVFNFPLNSSQWLIFNEYLSRISYFNTSKCEFCTNFKTINTLYMMKIISSKNGSIALGMLVSSLVLFTACQSDNSKTEKSITDTVALQKEPANVFDHMLVDNRKDPSCGMPVTAGINDTAHYKDKVLGFCSKECKDDFLKNPEGNLAAAEIKKEK